MRIIQVLVGAAPGDAVTNAALAVRDLLEREGTTSELYAWHIDPRVATSVKPLSSCRRSNGGVGSEADLVILHASIGQAEVSSWVLAGVERLVLCYHNISPSEAFVDHDPAFAALLDEGRADLVRYRDKTTRALAVSQFNATELVALGYRDVRVSPLLLDPARLTTVTSHGPTEHHLLEAMEGPVVLSVGQLLPHKRPDFLLEAFFIMLTYLVPEAHLIVAGAHRLTRYTENIQTFMKELNLKRVWLTNHVPDDQLAAFYRRADVFAVTSEHEGFGAPLLEAMAFDVPVVARDFAAVAETLGRDRMAGLLIGPDDPPAVFAEALATVIEQRRVSTELVRRGRIRLGEATRSRAEEIFWANIVDLLEGPGQAGTDVAAH